MNEEQFERAWAMDYKALAKMLGVGQSGSDLHTAHQAVLDAKVTMATERMARATFVLAIATVVLAVATVVLVAATAGS